MTKIIAILIWINSSSSAFATQCAYSEPKVRIQSKKFIILGKVTQVTGDKVNMKVVETFGAPVTSNVVLDYTRKYKMAGDPGSERFTVGNDYLIATNQYHSDGSQTGIAKPSICEFQEDAGKAKDLIKWLESPEFKNLETNIKPN